MITIRAEELVKGLKPIVRVVRAKSTFPILSHVLISVATGNMRLIGSDSETEIRNDIGVDGDNTEFTVPAFMFNDLCKSWPKDSLVTIGLKGDKALVKCGRSKANLEVLLPDDYPLNDDKDYQFIDVDSKAFCDALGHARLAINKSHVNPSLRSVSICFEAGRLVIGGFCSEHHISEIVAVNSELEKEVLISDSGVDALLFCASQFDRIELGFSKSNVAIKAGELFVTTRTVDAKVAKLPDKFNNIDNRVSFSVDKQLLMSVVNRALIFCRSDLLVKKATLTSKDGMLVISAFNERNMEFIEDIECEMSDNFHVCFNLVAFEKIFSVSENRCSIFVIEEVNGIYWNTGSVVALIAGIKT